MAIHLQSLSIVCCGHFYLSHRISQKQIGGMLSELWSVCLGCCRFLHQKLFSILWLCTWLWTSNICNEQKPCKADSGLLQERVSWPLHAAVLLLPSPPVFAFNVYSTCLSSAENSEQFILCRDLRQSPQVDWIVEYLKYRLLKNTNPIWFCFLYHSNNLLHSDRIPLIVMSK